MDETTNVADDCQKLLDAGHTVVLYRNPLGSYTGVVLKRKSLERTYVHEAIDKLPDDGPHITDDFTPAKMLYRLTEKFTTGRIVGAEGS